MLRQNVPFPKGEPTCDGQKLAGLSHSSLEAVKAALVGLWLVSCGFEFFLQSLFLPLHQTAKNPPNPVAK